MASAEAALPRAGRLTAPLRRLSLIRWDVWRDIMRQLGRAKGRLGLLALLGCVQSLLVLPMLHLVRYCFDTAIPQRDAHALIAIGALLLLFRLLSSGLFLIGRLQSVRLAKETVAQTRQDLVDWLYRTPRDYLARSDAAWVQGRVVHETERLDNVLSSLLTTALPALLTIGVLVVMLAWINWQLLLIAAVLAPAAWALGLLAGRKVKRSVGEFQHNFERFNRGISFVVRQMELTRSRGFEDGEVGTQAERIGTLQRSGVRMAMSFAAHGQLQAVAIAAVGLVVLVVGGLQVIAGSLSLGDLIAFYVGAGFLNAAASQLTTLLPDLLSCDESLARLEALKSGVAESAYDGCEVPRLAGSIRLDNVTFGYGGTPVLDGLSLDLAPGANVAIIGPNGSGKTTIVDLILGFQRPQSGRVLAEGVPYHRLDLRALRRRIGFVPQRPTFFTGTVAENLAYGRPEQTHEDIVAAAERAGVDAFVKGLPQGYDTPIGEGGLLLSGGEAQRLAIARALVGEPRLLIFDEPTNHLDAASVANIMGRLLGAPSHPALLTITHDPAVVALVAQVYRLQDGRLAPLDAAAAAKEPVE